MSESTTQRQPGSFANPSVVVESWYVAARSKDVKRGEIHTTDEFGKRLAIWRDSNGAVHVTDGRCAHLGADLGQGRIENDEIVCAFHCWRWGADGKCTHAPLLDEVPKRSLQVYPCVEKHGFVWVYLGKKPKFEVPDAPSDGKFRTFSLPSQHIQCHGHIVVVNGLDAAHFAPLHNFHPENAPKLEQPHEHMFSMLMQSRPAARLARLITRTRKAPLESTFATIGSNIAYLSIHSPLKFHVIFTARPSLTGGCHTQTIVFLPRGPIAAIQAIATTILITRDDAWIFKRLQFMPAYAEADQNLSRFAEYVDSLDVFNDNMVVVSPRIRELNDT